MVGIHDNAFNNKKLQQYHNFKFNLTYMTYLNLISADNNNCQIYQENNKKINEII